MLIAAVLALSFAASPADKTVEGKVLQSNLTDYVDRTVTVTDQWSGLSTHFMSAHKDKGIRPSTHYRVRLHHVGIPVFLPKTKKNQALVESLKHGDPVTLVGVVEAHRIDGRGFTEISIVIPDRDVVFFNVKKLTPGAALAEPVFRDPLKVTPKDFLEVDMDSVSLTPSDYLDNDVAIEKRLGRKLHVMNYTSSWERQQGLTKKTAIKLGLGVGFPVFLARNEENLAHVKAWRKGATVRFYGTILVEQRSAGDFPVLVVHRFEVNPKKSKAGTHEL